VNEKRFKVIPHRQKIIEFNEQVHGMRAGQSFEFTKLQRTHKFRIPERLGIKNEKEWNPKTGSDKNYSGLQTESESSEPESNGEKLKST
jgi:hypothetical protein